MEMPSYTGASCRAQHPEHQLAATCDQTFETDGVRGCCKPFQDDSDVSMITDWVRFWICD